MKMLDVVVEKTTFLIVAVFVRDASKLCQFVTDMAESQMLNIRKIIDLKLDICNLRAGKKNSANSILYTKRRKNKSFFLIYNFINS